MPKHKPLVLALAASLLLGLAAPDADAQRRRAAPKAPAGPTACGDFYAFANKDWLVANPVPATGTVSALGELQARVLEQQRELLSTSMSAPQGNVQKLLGDFWASGLDEAAVEADGSRPIAPLLDRINGIKRAKDVPPAIAALHQVGIPVAFNFSADLDLADLERHVGYFAQGGTGLPDPAYYTREDADARALLGRYNNYVQKILALTGTAEKDLAGEAQQVIDLETRIARASRPIPTLRDPRQNHALVATDTLGKTYKRLQLDAFLAAQGVTDDSVSIANPALFTALDDMVGSLKPAQWKTYLRFQVGNAMAPYLSKGFRDAEFDFRGRVLRGETAQPSRELLTLQAINHAAGQMVAREYVGRYLPDASRSRAEAIAGEVRDALVRGLARNTWMDEATRAEAGKKLAALKIEVGAPRRDVDYTVQPMGRGSFGGNMLIASTWHHREEMKRIGRGNAERRWNVQPHQPALAYDAAHNRLVISAAVLQPPVLDMSRDGAAHYGSLGALIAHELSHAIDGKGRMLDASGTVRDWWTPGTAGAWSDRLNRLSAQYGSYDIPNLEGRKVNATLTRDENAADLAAVELAWDALQQAQPALEKDGRQAFYTAWAELWRQQPSAAFAEQQATSASHAPGKWRANGPLSNQPAFSEVFACKATDAMRRKDDDQVSLWR
ncbi:M13 family metallopeptidase [Luteimonas sp. MC1825]|uniref:M13 family metallopeptidase n=1 Tax=Luteimonas sp. MC1825 TaxID=2761107 RepID=UPI001616B10D|nr:M13 family metallopeptidase [Luteimonas sp. MC1825]MBB6599127.1 M13 family metallopeptidase [Luteimonas sp. MC1825]QOC89252.1 M13 family metallopeptidase [Luteimonas sp. MC1825]